MANITLSDLLSFAKAGYTPKDVKELLSMELPETKKAESVQQESEIVPDPAENEKGQKTEETLLQQDPTSDQETADNKIIDYKSKYEEAQETIKKLQENNIKQDISGERTVNPMATFDDILRSMM